MGNFKQPFFISITLVVIILFSILIVIYELSPFDIYSYGAGIIILIFTFVEMAKRVQKK